MPPITVQPKKGYKEILEVPEIEVVREIINVDMLRIKQEAIEEAERNGRFDIAQDLRRRRLGVDTLEIKLYDQHTGKEIAFYIY